jgi:UDP-glucose 4-epimerase
LLDAAANGEPARLTGDGRQTRDFVYVDDVVDALERTRRRGTGLVVNVGTGVQTSLRELATMIGSDPPPSFVAERQGELGRFCVSPVRARIHLGWAAWTTLADGLAALRDTR